MGFRASLLSFVLSVYVCGLTQQVKGRDWSLILLQFLYQIIFFIFTFELYDNLNWDFSVKKKIHREPGFKCVELSRLCSGI